MPIDPDTYIRIGNFLMGLGFGMTAFQVGWWSGVFRERSRVTPEPEPPEHQCPFCGRILRAITVRCLDDMDEPIPADAKWICPSAECEMYYFADRPAGKPEPIEEV